jgi:hypothetical protein
MKNKIIQNVASGNTNTIVYKNKSDVPKIEGSICFAITKAPKIYKYATLNSFAKQYTILIFYVRGYSW